MMITNALIRKGSIGDREGYCFEVYYDNRPYPNIISALYKTERGARGKLTHWRKTGKYSAFGNAE